MVCNQKRTVGDTLIVAELSRLGHTMFETRNIINALGESGVRVLFVRRPELPTAGPQTKLLLAISTGTGQECGPAAGEQVWYNTTIKRLGMPAVCLEQVTDARRGAGRAACR